MDVRTPRMARAMADAGAGLLALPLGELPDIASVQLMTERPDGLAVRLQLSAGNTGDAVAALLAWADAMTDPAASGCECEDYIRVEVTGLVGGVRIAVWDHLRGPDLNDTGCFLSLPLDGDTHRLSLGVLRALARHRVEQADA